MNQPERQIQRSIRRYLTGLGYTSVAVPNGSQLAGGAVSRARQMSALKLDGLTVGFPDLIVFAPEGRVGFIEVKTEGGRLSEAQANVRYWMTRDGHKHAVCRSIDDVTETLEKWGWNDAKQI